MTTKFNFINKSWTKVLIITTKKLSFSGLGLDDGYNGTDESHCGTGWRLLLTHFLFLPVQLVGFTPHLSRGKVLEPTTSQFLSLLFISCCNHAEQQRPTDSAESLRRAAVACSIPSCPLGVSMSRNHCDAILWSGRAWTGFMFIRRHCCSQCLSSLCAHPHLSMCFCVVWFSFTFASGSG